MPPTRPAGLDSTSFRAYWAGEATALAGSSLHAVALPVLAVLELGATPGQVSLLTAAATTPAFVLALPAGVLGDRYAKKPLMVATDLAAAAVVSAVPLCWAAGELSMPVLYVVALLLGALTVLHQAAAIAIVPELVTRDQLPAAHSRISAANAVADTAGIYGGTLLIGLAGAARVLWLDCLSYLISACLAARIRPARPSQPANDQPVRMLTAIRAGLSYVLRDPIQRPLLLMTTAHAFADYIVITYYAYTLLTELDAGSIGMGAVMGVAGAGGLVGALAWPRLAARYGPGPLVMTGILSHSACTIPLLLAEPGPVWLTVLATAGFVKTAGAVAAGSTQRALRQLLCPPHLQSRAQQTSVWLVAGIRPLAALTAGAIAAAFGVKEALLAGTVLYLIPVALLWASPVRHLTAMPSAPAGPAIHPPPTPTKERHVR
ncbi:MFS transporter [Streptomyces niveus]|uniref:MFS transporter n=1 Tax=Streptomyces niveus TaxID=193462 RepID=UPI0036B3FC22